jgi:hypothetical protein
MIEIKDKGTWVMIDENKSINAVEKGHIMCRTHPIEGTAIIQILKGYGARQEEILSAPWREFACKGETVEETLENIMLRLVPQPFSQMQTA